MPVFWINQALGYPPGAGQRRIWREQKLARQRSSAQVGHPPTRPTGAQSRGHERSAVHTVDEVRAAIAGARWTQSKGYERKDGAQVSAHQYIVRPKQPEAHAIISWMIAHAEDRYSATYGGWRYTYWNCDGWKYWTMGIILNRVPLDDAAADPLAGNDPTAASWKTADDPDQSPPPRE
jgi:hypothetical protein